MITARALLVVLAIATPGCEVSSPRDDAAPVWVGDASACGPDLEPPDVAMSTLVGVQLGVAGSYCADFTERGCIRCVDRGSSPDEFTLVRRGDEVTFSMREGRLVGSERCNPACPPSVRIQQLDCDRLVSEQQQRVTEDRPWTVELDPGVYVLLLESHVDQANDGWKGGMSAAFGLVVDETRERTILRAPAVLERCNQQDAAAAVPGP